MISTKSLSIRHFILLLLVATVTVTLLCVFLLRYFVENKEKQYKEIASTTEFAHLLILKDVNLIRDFFENETINAEFFKSGNSSILRQHFILSARIDSCLNQLITDKGINHANVEQQVFTLKEHAFRYKKLVMEIVHQIRNRGFKDYGTEGRMRQAAHRLEYFSASIDPSSILQLRRHEKDYILRQEKEYLMKHSALAANLKNSIIENDRLKPTLRDTLLNLLELYQDYFTTLVDLENKIGIKSSTGLKKEIDKEVELMSSIMQNIQASTYSFLEEKSNELKLTQISFFTVFIILSLSLSYYFSQRLSRSLIDLSEKMSEFIASDFKKQNINTHINSKNEIHHLVNHFGQMEKHIINQMKALEFRNAELGNLLDTTVKDIQEPLLEMKSHLDRNFAALNHLVDPEELKLQNTEWNRILNTVNELSLVRSIKQESITFNKLDLAALIRTAYQKHKALPGYSSIIFSLTYSLRGEVVSSAELIEIILSVLFENSIKHLSPRSGHSFIKVKVCEEDKYMVKLQIQDNGKGLSRRDVERLQRIDKQVTKVNERIGMAFYIIQNSLEKLNGSFLLESDPSYGTNITLYLPNKRHESKAVYSEVISEQPKQAQPMPV